MEKISTWWEAHFLGAELGLAAAIAMGFYSWGEFFDGYATINAILNGNRSDVYGTLAAIFGALLGFTITSVSIILGYAESERLAVVRESQHYPTLWRIFTSANKALGLATLLALVGLVIDRDATPAPWILYVNAFAALLAFARLMRCIWALEKVISLITAPSKARRGDQI